MLALLEAVPQPDLPRPRRAMRARISDPSCDVLPLVPLAPLCLVADACFSNRVKTRMLDHGSEEEE